MINNRKILLSKLAVIYNFKDEREINKVIIDWSRTSHIKYKIHSLTM